MAAAAKQAVAEPDADTEPDENEEGAAKPKPKLPLKLIIIAVAGVVVLGGGGTAAFFMFGAPKDATHEAAPAPKPPVFFDLPDVLVNLASVGNERVQYLKVKVVLEVPDQALIAQIQPLMPRVMDAFQTYLRELRPADLDGSAGLYRLKEELTRRVNTAIAPSHINAVLFKEIVVQ
ncbi:MAG: flagellar basal body-associated protein FliL [Xanthobacteraceae bacterium]